MVSGGAEGLEHTHEDGRRPARGSWPLAGASDPVDGTQFGKASDTQAMLMIRE